ncbi:MAG TPA: hypothetical protein PLU30_06360 [Verrucomicrobiae bacterium]|nr:hypothetical protein [Verrucomicrobiae bacterium]
MREFHVSAAIVGFIMLGHSVLTAAGQSPSPVRLPMEQDFGGIGLPAGWEPGGRPNSFRVIEGALEGKCAADDNHGPSIGVPVVGHDLAVEFEAQFIKAGALLFLIDGDSQFGGQAHLLRVGLSGSSLNIAQDRGSPASKQAQHEARVAAQKAGKTVAAPTPEQLADPAFYRTEALGRQAAKLTDGRRHRVRVGLRGNDVTVRLDEAPPVRAKGTVLDVKKTRIVFLVGQAGVVRIDNVKVREVN